MLAPKKLIVANTEESLVRFQRKGTPPKVYHVTYSSWLRLFRVLNGKVINELYGPRVELSFISFKVEW